MNIGASTVPRKIFAAVDTPTAPPTPIDFFNTHENAFTIIGRMRK